MIYSWSTLMIYFYARKIFFSILDVAHNNPFFVQIWLKKTTFKRFYQLFLKNCWIAREIITTDWIL